MLKDLPDIHEVLQKKKEQRKKAQKDKKYSTDDLDENKFEENGERKPMDHSE